jgi:2-dehydropantoate 2-reductase
LRVGVIGAGAIGAVLARAAAGGASGGGSGGASGGEVLLCVRTPIPSLSVGDPDGSWSDVPLAIVSSPAEVSAAVDVVFLTVKATDTAGAAPWLAVLCSPATLVVVVQNGLDHALRVAPYVPPGSSVVAGLAYMAAERLSAGRVRHLAGGSLVVPSSAASLVAAAVPSLRVRGRDDMVSATWQKLLGNLVANPITALTLRRIDVMGSPGIADLARGLLEEAMAVGRASGATLDDSLVERTVAGTAQYGSETGSSMLYDRLAGRHMEHQYLTGEVVRRGGELAIPVPLNAAVLALLEAIDREITRL